jgi:hypothetical protein
MSGWGILMKLTATHEPLGDVRCLQLGAFRRRMRGEIAGDRDEDMPALDGFLRASLVLAFLPALFLWASSASPSTLLFSTGSPPVAAIALALFHDPLRLRASIGCQRTTDADLLARELARLSADVSFVTPVGLDQCAGPTVISNEV